MHGGLGIEVERSFCPLYYIGPAENMECVESRYKGLNCLLEQGLTVDMYTWFLCARNKRPWFGWQKLFCKFLDRGLKFRTFDLWAPASFFPRVVTTSFRRTATVFGDNCSRFLGVAWRKFPGVFASCFPRCPLHISPCTRNMFLGGCSKKFPRVFAAETRNTTPAIDSVEYIQWVPSFSYSLQVITAGNNKFVGEGARFLRVPAKNGNGQDPRREYPNFQGVYREMLKTGRCIWQGFSRRGEKINTTRASNSLIETECSNRLCEEDNFLGFARFGGFSSVLKVFQEGNSKNLSFFVSSEQIFFFATIMTTLSGFQVVSARGLPGSRNEVMEEKV